MANSFNNLLFLLGFVAIFGQAMASSRLISPTPGPSPNPIETQKIDTTWYDGRATFYGDFKGGETMEGACGYGNLFQQGYGLATAALSTALFNNGGACGACFEIMCVNNEHKWCIPNAGTIKVTATNFCPPNYTKTQDIWCNPPQRHFDLSLYMFTKMAPYRAGVIPVRYRRTRCQKLGGIRFELKGNPYWLLVLPYNVGGAGDVVDLQIKGSSTGRWLQMKRNWGQNWEVDSCLVGQSLSFRVTTSDWKTKEFDNVVPSSWKFGQNFVGNYNF